MQLHFIITGNYLIFPALIAINYFTAILLVDRDLIYIRVINRYFIDHFNNRNLQIYFAKLLRNSRIC